MGNTNNPRPASVFWKPLTENREVCVYKLLYGGARVCIGLQSSDAVDDAYSYFDIELAVLAAALWDGDGDPIDGWFHHFRSRRYREHGDPARETVRAY